jgi:uncharacterized membrane protein YphA (DoxX/SURF4 family)
MRVVNNYPQPFLIYPFARSVSGDEVHKSILRQCAVPLPKGKCALADLRPANQPEGETEMKAPFLIGRLLFAGFFINSGISHLQKRKEMADYARAKGVPAPELAVTLSAVPLIAGGASLLLGVKPKAGAMAILGFLAGVSPVMHDFWRDEDPETRNTNMIMFMKNVALAGAALALLGVEEPWEASLQPGQPSLSDKVRRIGRRIAA